MAKKRDRAFLLCPRWRELTATSGDPGGLKVDPRTLAAIGAGRPVARSTLRKALLDARRLSGTMFDVDAYIVDRRTHPEPAAR